MAKTTTKKDVKKDIPVVYAYGFVSDAMASQVASMLDIYSSMNPPCIDLHVNSAGGSTGCGTAIRNCIKNCRVPVDIYIDGVAASMGAFMALSGRRVYMSRYARMMLHEGRVIEMDGTASDLREMADEVDAANNNLMAMTMERTKMSEADVKDMFFNGKDNWFSADEAKKLGLIDDIYDIDEVNVPQAANHIEVYAVLSEAYQNGLFNTKNDTMPEFKMPKEVLAAVGLQEGATETEYNMAVMAVVQKNSDMTLQLEQQRVEAVTKEVTAMLTGAVEGKKITAELSNVYAVQFANNPSGLKAVLAAMPGFVSVSTQINQQDVNNGNSQVQFKPEVVALVKEGWDALHKSNRLVSLKQADPVAYKELYKTKYGCYPNESPLPVGVSGNLALDTSNMKGVNALTGKQTMNW